MRYRYFTVCDPNWHIVVLSRARKWLFFKSY